MTGMGKYKVSDLVKETGVARTTINDWLQRYGQYLTYEIRGKRKLYTDHAVGVLREIAELRNAGRNSFEIEDALAARYPVRPEIAEEPNLDVTGDDDDDNDDEGDDGAASPPDTAAGPEFAVIAKKQTDEIARLIGEQLRRLNDRLETIEQAEQRARRHSMVWAMAFLVVVVLFTAGGIVIFRSYDAGNRELRALAEKQNRTALELERQRQDIQAKQQELQNLTVTLDHNSRDYEQNVRKLQSDLSRQRSEFENNLQRISRDADVRAQRVRDDAAAERLALLKKLYNLAEEGDRNALAPGLQSNKRLLEEMDKLRQQLDNTAKSGQPSASAAPARNGK